MRNETKDKDFNVSKLEKYIKNIISQNIIIRSFRKLSVSPPLFFSFLFFKFIKKLYLLTKLFNYVHIVFFLHLHFP